MRRLAVVMMILLIVVLIVVVVVYRAYKASCDTYTSCIPVSGGMPASYTFLLGLNGLSGTQLSQLDFSNSTQQGPTYPSQWSVDVNTIYSAIPVSVRYARYCPMLNSSCTPEEVCLSSLPLAVNTYYSVLILFNSEDMGYNTQTNTEIYSETWPQTATQFEPSSTIAQNAPVYSKGYLLYKGLSEYSFLFYQWEDNIMNSIPNPAPLVQGLLFNGGSVPSVLPSASSVTLSSIAKINYATPNPADVGPPGVGSVR